MNSQMRIAEREYNRISKILNSNNQGCLERKWKVEDLKKEYRKIILIIHPDKNDNNPRFQELTRIVVQIYQSLLEKRHITERKSEDVIVLGHPVIRHEDMDVKSNKCKKRVFERIQSIIPYNEVDTSKALSLHDLTSGQREKLKDFLIENPDRIKINIAMDGAEHTSKKCKSKANKHQKGLQQRVTQKKNAERRLKNHLFSFTNNISIH